MDIDASISTWLLFIRVASVNQSLPFPAVKIGKLLKLLTGKGSDWNQGFLRLDRNATGRYISHSVTMTKPRVPVWIAHSCAASVKVRITRQRMVGRIRPTQ
jgi:hypothetical protein